ncbi:MAG: hypothetical protein KJ906_00860 [Nanoarchaeota archaeon]|nr:hypothetical protein [Nanoarchaeota archaeon]
MSDFIPVLTTGVLILLLLFIAGTGIIDFGGTSADVNTNYYGEFEDFRDKIEIGENFTVSNFRKTGLYSTFDGTVQAGIVSNLPVRESFNVNNLEDIDHGRLDIIIEDTNAYGAFVIDINGENVYAQALLPGVYTAVFNRDSFKDKINSVEVKSSGSGWRIWAPTTYDFKLNVSGEKGNYIEYVKVFNLTYIPSKAFLRVYIDNRTTDGGSLKVFINGYKITESTASVYKDFDVNVLRDDENVVKFIADKNTNFDIDTSYIVVE